LSRDWRGQRENDKGVLTRKKVRFYRGPDGKLDYKREGESLYEGTVYDKRWLLKEGKAKRRNRFAPTKGVEKFTE